MFSNHNLTLPFDLLFLHRCFQAMRTSCLPIPAGTHTLPPCASTSTGISTSPSRTQPPGNCPSAATRVTKRPGRSFSTHLSSSELQIHPSFGLSRFPGVSGWFLPPGQRLDDDPDHQQRLQHLPVWPNHSQQPAVVAEGQAVSQLGSHGRGMGQNVLQAQLWYLYTPFKCFFKNAKLNELFTAGTYNNQYMVVDRSKVKLGRSIDDGALTVVEQIPGLVEFSDQTQALRRGNTSPVPASDAARLTDPYGASFPLSLAARRSLAILQHSLPPEHLHPERIREDVVRIWRGILLRPLPQGQDLPPRPGQREGPGLSETHHEIQRWVALYMWFRDSHSQPRLNARLLWCNLALRRLTKVLRPGTFSMIYHITATKVKVFYWDKTDYANYSLLIPQDKT